MIRRRSIAVPASVALLGFAGSAMAATNLGATLLNSNEPGNIQPTVQATGLPRASFGSASLVLNDAQTELTMTVTVTGIDLTGSQTADTNDNLTAAHIHGMALVGGNPGAATFPVVWGFMGSPDHDVNPNDLVVTPFLSGAGGVVTSKWDLAEGNNTTLTAQLPNLLGGTAYLNFHTAQFAGGEIRGTILVPEPSSVALLGAACGAALLRRRHATTKG